MKTVYLAARFSRQLEMRGYASDLAKIDITVTSRWITGDHGENVEATMTSAELARCAHEDIEDIDAANALVLFTDAPSTRGGMWVELGYALGRGIPVIACGPAANIFCEIPEVIRLSSWRLVVSWLSTREPDPARPGYWRNREVSR